MSLIRRDLIGSVQRVLLAALLIVGLAVVSLSVRLYVMVRRAVTAPPQATGAPSLVPTPTRAAIGLATTLPDSQPTATPSLVPSLPTAMPSPTSEGPIRIGIVAGHWEHDSGAVCSDGLTEVEINLAVAELVVEWLQDRGYDAEMLAEFSPRLDGYRAAALLSIHADACNVPEASGFKVARVDASMVPELEDHLVDCLTDRYAAATGLAFHRNSITFDMTEYHAFFEVEPTTPAAIIEIGFMGADRRLLTRRQGRVAKGIVDGLICFLEP